MACTETIRRGKSAAVFFFHADVKCNTRHMLITQSSVNPRMTFDFVARSCYEFRLKNTAAVVLFAAVYRVIF